MLENKNTGDVTTAKHHPLKDVTDHMSFPANIEEVIPFSVPSPQITPKHMVELANKINEASTKYDGFVITHGTDTLEETAYFLDLTITVNKPVIITGAMRSANEIGSDALYNLISSLRTATSDAAWDKGVLVVMNDEIHTARNVTKTSTSNIATFKSPQYGPIGIVTKDDIIFHHAVLSKYTYPVSKVNKHVYLLKAYAGMTGDIFDAVHQLKPDGLVIEGLGQGNLPKDTLNVLQHILKENIPVVLVSRCYQGIVQPTYAYDGGGRQLKEIGVIFANGLTGPKARLKLLIMLEITSNFQVIKETFEKK